MTASEIALIYDGGHGLLHSMLNVCDYPETPPVTPGESGRKKILLKGKLRNVVLNGKPRDFGAGSSAQDLEAQEDMIVHMSWPVSKRQQYRKPWLMVMML